MSYSSDMNFLDWISKSSADGMAIINAINAAKITYDKWYTLTYGLTDAQIAELPQFAGRTEADITAMKYAVGVFDAMNTALTPTLKGYVTPVL
jgi:hypothetical protein